jgi:hypothetical protein
MRVYLETGDIRLLALSLMALSSIENATVYVEDDCIIVEVEE